MEGVVLHADRSLTVHMKPDFDGGQVAYMLDPDGIWAAQVKAPEGTTGLIDRSALVDLVRPVRRAAYTRNEPGWERCGIDDLMNRIRVVQSANGDWYAMTADPIANGRSRWSRGADARSTMSHLGGTEPARGRGGVAW